MTITLTHPTCTSHKHDNRYAATRLGCRCPEALNARRLYAKRLREHRQPPAHLDATGTVRRLQALARLGWRQEDIALALGHETANRGVFRLGNRGLVHHTTAAAVAKLYDRWSMTLGPSELTRQRAIKAGWAPPLAWDDDGSIDDPNTKPNFRGPERIEVDIAEEIMIEVRRLLDLGHTRKEIEKRCHLTWRAARRTWQQIRQEQQNAAAGTPTHEERKP